MNPTAESIARISEETRAALQMLEALQGYFTLGIALGAVALFASIAARHI